MDLASLYPTIMAFVLIAILLGVGLVVLQTLQDSASITGTAAATAINTTQAALDDFPSWFAIIVVVIAAAIILGIVIKSFSGRDLG